MEDCYNLETLRLGFNSLYVWYCSCAYTVVIFIYIIEMQEQMDRASTSGMVCVMDIKGPCPYER